MQTSKTPAENNLKYEVTQEDLVRIDLYKFRSPLSSLLCIVKQTSPDIRWITNVLSRSMDDPSVVQLNADKLVLK